MKGPDSRGCLTVTAAAKELGVHPNTIRNWCDDGAVAYETLPGSGFRRIPQGEVERLKREKIEALHLEIQRLKGKP